MDHFVTRELVVGRNKVPVPPLGAVAGISLAGAPRRRRWLRARTAPGRSSASSPRSTTARSTSSSASRACSRQTYANFEYVLSDNRSTDESLAIARSYAERDGRMRVVAHDEHLTNHLQSWNRSMRLISPDAKYVKVVHADDWLFDACLERMVAVAEQHPTVGLVSAYRLDEDQVTLDGLPTEVTMLPGRAVVRSLLLGGPYPELFGSPTLDAAARRPRPQARPVLLRGQHPRRHGGLRRRPLGERLRLRPRGADLHAAPQRGRHGVHPPRGHVHPRRSRRVPALGADLPLAGGVRPQARRPAARVRAASSPARVGSLRSREFRHWHAARLRELLGRTSPTPARARRRAAAPALARGRRS